MKRSINKKKNYLKKKIIMTIVILIFILFVSLSLIVSERNYFILEKGFKSINSLINTLLIDNMYSSNKFSNNIIDSKTKYLQKENDDLKNILGLKNNNSNYEIANTTNHLIKFWYDKLEINKGYKDGIKKGDAVINQEGLVGFISKTSGRVSEVKLLTSVNDNYMLPVTITLDEKKIAGVLSGYDKKNNLFKVTDVMNKDELKAGSLVTLSGYDNESYKGIYVGSIVKEEISNYGLSKTIWIESSVNFDDLLYLAVIKEVK